jgi:hypothetical protein
MRILGPRPTVVRSANCGRNCAEDAWSITRDEARQIAANVAKPLELFLKPYS